MSWVISIYIFLFKKKMSNSLLVVKIHWLTLYYELLHEWWSIYNKNIKSLSISYIIQKITTKINHIKKKIALNLKFEFNFKFVYIFNSNAPQPPWSPSHFQPTSTTPLLFPSSPPPTLISILTFSSICLDYI